MSNYIECKKILDFCNAVINRQGNEEEMNVVVESFKAFAEYVKALQPADVQPVVRCSECEHWNDGICCCDDYEIHCQDYYVGDMHTEPDFFCGFGKRKGVDNVD